MNCSLFNDLLPFLWTASDFFWNYRCPSRTFVVHRRDVVDPRRLEWSWAPLRRFHESTHLYSASDFPTDFREQGILMKILVVDDEPDFRAMLREWLFRQGHDAHDVSDEREVLKILQQSHYDLVTLDLMMPQANGLTLVSQIRNVSPKTQVIVVSGEADVRVAVEVIKAGAQACMAKPVEFEAFRDELTRLKNTLGLNSSVPGRSVVSDVATS